MGVATRDALLDNTYMPEVKSDLPDVRRIACADAALRAEMKRVEKMTVEERINVALSMGKNFSVIRTITKER